MCSVCKQATTTTTPTTRPAALLAVEVHVGRVVGALSGGGPVPAVLVLVCAAG